MTITSAFHEKRHLEYIKQKIRKLFGISSKTFASYTNENVFVLDCYSSELVKFLTADGLAIGNKIKNKAALPGWISQKDDFIFGALRGLFDTDGGIYRKQKKYSRAFIEFQTTYPTINRDICFLLRKTKFTPSKTFTRSGFTKKKGPIDSRKIILPKEIIVSAGRVLDVGSGSFEEWKKIIKRSRLIVWNGPLGYLEGGHARGTKKLISILSKAKSEIIIGGGDTLDCLPRVIVERTHKNFFISTGGGAMLEYLVKRTLPGIKALK